MYDLPTLPEPRTFTITEEFIDLGWTAFREKHKLPAPMVEKKIGSLPVVNGTELVGIFTEIDALKLLLRTLSNNGA